MWILASRGYGIAIASPRSKEHFSVLCQSYFVDNQLIRLQSLRKPRAE